MEFRQKLTIITTKVIGWLFDIGDHELSRDQDFPR